MSMKVHVSLSKWKGKIGLKIKAIIPNNIVQNIFCLFIVKRVI